MAVGMKDIKNRIKSVESTMQITKAMELVASSKLRKAKEKTEKSKPFFDTMYNTMKQIANTTNDFSSSYVRSGEIKTSGYIIIGGDKGLAGGYNANLFRRSEAHLKGKKAKLVVVGKKAIEYFEKKGYDIAYKFPDFAETMDFVQANQLAAVVLELFDKGEIDDLTLIYTEFVSALTQNVQVKKLLPLYIEKEDHEYKAVVYDPSPTAVFDSIIPIYLEGVLYAAVLEAFASEQGARRTAMEAANDNAKEMIEQLNLLYNRARQANITQELSEIVSGAEALK
ncbi:MAG: ATP synthase F1 subunit gamma [Filifactor alocis]|nr:ATP synthase F1 subunit gamma [Filifactor alocis]